MPQTDYEASVRFIEWLDRQVTASGRGDGIDWLEVDPRGRFWLGRLAPEYLVLTNPLGARGERLDPCAAGIRVRPQGSGPWTFTITVSMKGWADGRAAGYTKSPEVSTTVSVTVSPDTTGLVAGTAELRAALDAAGLNDHSAEIRVEVEAWREARELVVTLLNTSAQPTGRPQPDRHLYETRVEVSGLATDPFLLEALPDSFRYDRRVPALGVNAGVVETPAGLQTSDTVVADRARPEFWVANAPQPDLTFDQLQRDPIRPLEQLLSAARDWGAAAWDLKGLETAGGHDWTDHMHAEAAEAAAAWDAELARFECGLEELRTNSDLRESFRLANGALKHSARGRYDRWRGFQIGFLVSSLRSVVDPTESEVVDTIWFATGGGKTETYLGLIVTAVLYDRLRGKRDGVSAWSRFPLRMLSLQQTQRFADALAGAELMRREAGIAGSEIRLGFYVGAAGTPNAIPLEAEEGQPNSLDPSMPGRYKVLLRCPFCHSEQLEMAFDRKSWTLDHRCMDDSCPWPEAALPFHVVDQEIYRFLPAVVIGTLDKAALIGMQAAMRGLYGPPLGLCSMPGHGFTYATRSKSPTGCLVPGCRNGTRQPIAQAVELWGPRLRLQDELHLLRDSLGAVDSHYEAILDHLQVQLGGQRPKVVASSATLTGVARQVDVLYQRRSRVFPMPGPTATSSFWSTASSERARRFVAVAPRGVTNEFVSDRIVTVLQESIRRLISEPTGVCDEAGVDIRWVDHLINIYGVDVIYGTTVKDVEAARRSVDTQIPFKVESQTLTGATPFEEVRLALERLENPEPNFEDRLHVIAASSMLSHGVDIDRLNIMVMLGLPLTTAEFIQTTARVGRRWPGLVYVLHRIVREREMANYLQFQPYVQQGDRFVEPIAVTRRSRRVLAVTTPGLVEARRLGVHEPSARAALTTVQRLRDYYATAGVNDASEADSLIDALGFSQPMDQNLRDDLRFWLRTYFTALNDPATSIRWPNELSPSGPVMRSLRDVEDQAPVVGDD